MPIRGALPLQEVPRASPLRPITPRRDRHAVFHGAFASGRRHGKAGPCARRARYSCVTAFISGHSFSAPCGACGAAYGCRRSRSWRSARRSSEWDACFRSLRIRRYWLSSFSPCSSGSKRPICVVSVCGVMAMSDRGSIAASDLTEAEAFSSARAPSPEPKPKAASSPAAPDQPFLGRAPGARRGRRTFSGVSRPMRVAIVDYGSGNLHSARKAFERAACEAGIAASVEVTADPAAVRLADRIVLPGVGAFADCAQGLRAISGMTEALDEAFDGARAPFLGICVGMQLLADARSRIRDRSRPRLDRRRSRRHRARGSAR